MLVEFSCWRGQTKLKLITAICQLIELAPMNRGNLDCLSEGNCSYCIPEYLYSFGFSSLSSRYIIL